MKKIKGSEFWLECGTRDKKSDFLWEVFDEIYDETACCFLSKIIYLKKKGIDFFLSKYLDLFPPHQKDVSRLDVVGCVCTWNIGCYELFRSLLKFMKAKNKQPGFVYKFLQPAYEYDDVVIKICFENEGITDVSEFAGEFAENITVEDGGKVWRIPVSVAEKLVDKLIKDESEGNRVPNPLIVSLDSSCAKLSPPDGSPFSGEFDNGI